MRDLLLKASLLVAFCVLAAPVRAAEPQCSGGAEWTNDLSPISPADWNRARAAHLIERAGFGETPDGIDRLVGREPAALVRELVAPVNVENGKLKAFDESGVFDAALDPFPPSRPAATDLAKANGEAMGVKVKPDGNRRMQAVADRFFYWLRASLLETRRLGNWWADRMLTTNRPLEEKMALFWHGHFATSEDKVRDYRKMLKQLQLFQTQGLGNFRSLLIGVAQDPAMLAFLDAGVNVKGAPNENFAREIMELFTMGPGNYQEIDIREGARAFTGWNFKGVDFIVNDAQHDASEKTFLGQRGAFDGVQVIDIILKQPVTAEFVAAKIYKFFVREDVSPDVRSQLGNILRNANYDVAPLLETIFLSRDFYAPESCGSHIKSPVELVISTYKKLGLTEVPGVPDLYQTTTALGQTLFWPPTVAGWAHGRSWITPGLLIERGNFVRDVVFPDIAFVPPDRHPGTNYQILEVHEKLAQGATISAATAPDNKEMAATSNLDADRDEDFNTRYASYRGWQMAIQRVKPLLRSFAQINLTRMVMEDPAPPKTPAEVVDKLVARMFLLPPSPEMRQHLSKFLEQDLGTSDVAASQTYMEQSLRTLLHLILSQPEYQLG